MLLKIPHHSWQREMNWRTYSFPELGVGQVQKKVEERSSNAIEVTNVGNWSSKCYFPMGDLENRETGTSLYWQIEHNGSWHWEIGNQNGHFYLNLTGPDELHELVIENCLNGGLRMDYAMLSRYSIQSTSDQDNYLKYATITANVPAALTPEQAAVWSYPLREGDKEEVVFKTEEIIILY